MSADLDESNSEREIGRHGFLIFVFGGRAAARPFAFEKCNAQEGGEHERQESDWKREGIGTGWSFSIVGAWGHETPGRRLTRPRRTRVREKGRPATSFEIEKTRIIFKYYIQQ